MRLLFCAAFAVGEPVRLIAGLNDRTMMRDAIQKRGCHLGVTEDRDPFAELQVRRDDDTGLLIELADEMEQQRATGFGERYVAQLVDDDAV